jgi:hypothetical protein
LFSIPRPSKIYPNWDIWFENKTIWQTLPLFANLFGGQAALFVLS